MVITYEQRMGYDLFMDVIQNSDVQISATSDFKIASGSANLSQAIINRVRTMVGELDLHPYYGCRLPSLIGTTPNAFTLQLARQYIREALIQEPRVAEILSIDVTYSNSLKNELKIEVQVLPIETEEPLNIIWPFFITGE